MFKNKQALALELALALSLALAIYILLLVVDVFFFTMLVILGEHNLYWWYRVHYYAIIMLSLARFGVGGIGHFPII